MNFGYILSYSEKSKEGYNPVNPFYLSLKDIVLYMFLVFLYPKQSKITKDIIDKKKSKLENQFKKLMSVMLLSQTTWVNFPYGNWQYDSAT
jgi:hypothetical protein